MKYDIVIFGGGVAGLWLLNILSDRGFNVLLIEKEGVGGTQTMASQGMIHGGQKYLMKGSSSAHAASVASLPARWDACIEGRGDIDLSAVRILSHAQMMWPAGSAFTQIGLAGATRLLKAKAKRLDPRAWPDALRNARPFARSAYELPEKVMDTGSLVEALSSRYPDRIRKGEVRSLDRSGRMNISGHDLEAQLVISAAGLGNEDVLRLLEVREQATQRRPLRQIMVKSMPHALYGHGIVNSPKPRVTVTSHPLSSGEYVWYVGGGIADRIAALSTEDAIELAKQEMKSVFKHLDWSGKEWAVWDAMRAEPYVPSGRLPEGPMVQEYGNVLMVWPTKLTLTPSLGDHVLSHILKKEVRPKPTHSSAPPPFPKPPRTPFPWEQATWVL